MVGIVIRRGLLAAQVGPLLRAVPVKLLSSLCIRYRISCMKPVLIELQVSCLLHSLL